MSKRYYTLLERSKDGLLWSPQFGDYDRAVVAQEGDDRRDGSDWVEGTKLKIIATGDKQSDIDAAIAGLNAVRVFRSIKDANLLDDRREYTVDDLSSMYGCNLVVAEAVYAMLHAKELVERS